MDSPHWLILLILLAKQAQMCNSLVRCCDLDQLLSEDQKCVGLVFSASNRETSGVYKEISKDPLFECDDGTKRLHFTTENACNGSLIEPIYNQTILEEDYCSHPSTRIGFNAVLFCRRPVQIKKCCPSGHRINRTAIDRCVAVDQGSSPQLPIAKIVDGDWILIQDDNVSSLHCDYDYNIYLPGYYSDHRFKVTSDRGLYIRKAAYAPIRQFKDYCIDSTVYANGTENLIAVTCLPKNFYVMRWLLRNVYSIINFISAILVLATFLVYLLIPSLRENIQGYSMLCFFACLIIMHLENGIFLSLRNEPHTWCLNKACVSGYFRLASSTWITVMGFNIWRQLNSTAIRRLGRKRLIKGFLFRSIYAWGLPLILTMVSYYYKEYNGCPDAERRCWSCDSVSRNLAQTPNIVLVTGNLVFFIPSACKIYNSLSFLQSSVPKHSLSKMEANRIHTIFRLFILMQFYTFPRIMQWFVDSERARPELLMLCATIFLMIGPCIFYSFVCRRETLMMIKSQCRSLVCRYRYKLPSFRSKSYQVNGVSYSANGSSMSTSYAVSTISSGIVHSNTSSFRLTHIN